MATEDRIWERWWQSSGRGELVELLWREWDPIFRGTPYRSPTDEYGHEADELGAMLRAGSQPEEIARSLYKAEHAMHLHPDDNDRVIDSQLARTIADWYTKSAPAQP